MGRRVLAAWAVLALAACGGDRVSTAGSFDDGVSTAGPYTEQDPAPPASGAVSADRATEADLLAALDRDFSPDRTLGYGPARDALYTWEQREHGALCGVYTAFCVTLGPGDPSAEAARLGVNAEHVWPQSKGARAEPLRSDLHHVFPAREQVNSSRGNLPFGEVPDDRADAWYHEAQSQSRPPRDDRDAWAERGAGRFEPPEARKGDVARAVFYVAAVYPEAVDPAFFPPMRADLLAWNRADPPDDAERARSAWVATLQGTENPFVRDPSLADRIWGAGPVAAGPPPPASVPPRTDPPGANAPGSTAGALRISEIHYDNAGEDVGEGVEVSGPAGTSLDGWTLVLVNGNGGAVYDTVPLSGPLPASGARWTATPGLQNGSPDGLALVAPDGRVAEFLSYEGVVTATGGPARGLRSTDIGASEAPGSPAGSALHRGGQGWTAGPATPGR